MKQTWINGRIGIAAATLGVAFALVGTGQAVAQLGGIDIGSSRTASVAVSEPAGISPVIGKSWATWLTNSVSADWPLATAPPMYSQVNFRTPDSATGGPITTAQSNGQMHADASVKLRKNNPGGAKVTCDLRIDGSSGSQEYTTTMTSATSEVTIPLVGHKAGLAAGDHNAGVRCWATGEQVYMDAVDLHAVVYGASVPG
jgi:hypothetical protein